MSIALARQCFYQEISQPEADINVAAAALYFAQETDPRLEPEIYLGILDQMALSLEPRLPAPRYPLKVIRALNDYFYGDLGFSGNRADYYDPHNSYLNQVIERRLGIPISLSLVYLELARRIDFPMVGVGMPGHFLIRPEAVDMEVYVDVFNQGEILFEQDCQDKFAQLYGATTPWQTAFLQSTAPKQFLARLLTNLKMIYLQQQVWQPMLTVCDYLLMLSPANMQEYRDRGLVHFQLGHTVEAKQDLGQYLRTYPMAADADRIQRLIEQLDG